MLVASSRSAVLRKTSRVLAGHTADVFARLAGTEEAGADALEQRLRAAPEASDRLEPLVRHARESADRLRRKPARLTQEGAEDSDSR